MPTIQKPAMQESLRRFSNSLLEMQNRRGKQKTDMELSEKDILSVLNKTVERFDKEDATQNEVVKKITREVSSNLKKGIETLEKEVKKRSKVREALENLGDGLIVVVFGRTNAGKSTLGNFLRGKQLRKAAFDNAWKDGHIQPGPIKVIESLADGKSLADAGTALDQEWFAEGSTETTREIQAFALPGLLWVDTPGFGSTRDQDLGELARKYVARADLVIYLDHSDNPGLRDITENLAKVLKGGRRTLIAINQSDRNERIRKDGKTVYDENGEPLQKRIPKSAEDRKKQEDYLTKALRAELPGQDIQAISVSTLLAVMAVESGDANEAERLYEGANLDALFNELAEVSREDLKYRDAIENCVPLINMALSDLSTENSEGKEVNISLTGLKKELAELEGSLEEKDFNVEAESKTILTRLGQDLYEEVDKLLQHPDFSRTVNPKPVFDKLAREADKKLREKMQRLMGEFWYGEALDATKPMSSLDQVVIEEKKERKREAVEIDRAPDIWWEYILDFFGWKLSETVYRTRTINLGLDLDKARDDLSQEIKSALRKYITQKLKGIRNICILQGIELFDARLKALDEAISELERQKEKLLTKLDDAAARK